jgi:hypothetical protein
MRTSRLIALVLLVAVVTVAYLYLAGKFRFMVRNRGVRIEVNGRPVKGEYVRGKSSFEAVVTRRDTAPARSYLLSFSVDGSGDDGSAVDCRQWVAPRMPIWIETPKYPTCVRAKGEHYVPLFFRDGTIRFTTAEGDAVRVYPNK